MELSFSCPAAIILPGHAGVQLMRQLRNSSASVGGLHAMPCGVFFHWETSLYSFHTSELSLVFTPPQRWRESVYASKVTS